jgi:hypothetical protein
MKQYIICISFLIFSALAFAQQAIEIGKVCGEEYRITADTALLRKALQQTIFDDTQIN